MHVAGDVCNSTDLPELEIISLLEEQLPVYKLRADTIFGYDQDDWLHTPLVEPDSALDLTTEQIEETLKYFSCWDIGFARDVTAKNAGTLETIQLCVRAVRMKRRGQRFVKADYYELDWYYEECTDAVVSEWRMALLTSAGSEDELEYSNQPEEDKEYVCLPSQGSTEQEEEEEEEYVCLASHGSTEQQEEEEMDEEQQVLCE
eukprot:superscaffoldBa00008693_g23562